MESTVDHIHLLLARQTHEVHGVAGNADRQVRVLLRMVHRVQKRLAVQHIHVHVVSGGAEEGVEHVRQIVDAVLGDPAQTLRHQGGRQ